MADDEANYKRLEDREWRKDVDKDRLMATTAINVLQEQVRALKEWKRETEVTLRGERGHGGLVGAYDKHDDKLTKLYAVIFQDPTGQKGVLHDVDYLMGRRKSKEQWTAVWSGRWWAFMTALVLAIVSSVTVIVTQWDKVEKFAVWAQKAMQPQTNPALKKAARAGMPRKKTIRYRIVPAPKVTAPQEAGDGAAQEDVQQ